MTLLHERKPRNTQSRLKNTLTLNQITEFTVKYTGHSPGPVSGPQTRMGQVPLGVQAQTHTGVVYMIICCWVRLRLLEFYRSPSQRMCRTIPKRQNRRIEEKPFSFSPMSARFTNRCLSVATIAAIDLPIVAAICLVAFRAKSVVRWALTLV